MIRLTEIAGELFRSRHARHKAVNLLAFLLNLCYIFFNLVSGIVYENILSVTFSAYYIIILSARYLVIGDAVSEDTKELLRASETTAQLLLISAFPITGIIIYTIIGGRVRRYPIWMLTVLAVYSLAGTLRSVIGLHKSVRLKSVVMRTAYSARLSAALLSLFNFQISLFSSLEATSLTAKALNILLGGLISVSVFCLAFSLGRINRRNKL